MNNSREEALLQVLGNAKDVKPIPGHKNTYSPEDYEKLYAKNLLVGALGNSDGFLTARIPEGAIEVENGQVIGIGRHAPMVLDTANYTANRYMIETVTPVQAKNTDLEAGKYLLVIWGDNMVDAISNSKELPKQVRAFRFKKVVEEGKENAEPEFEFMGATMIPSDKAYKMTGTLDEGFMLSLINKINQQTTQLGSDVKETTADDIANLL